MARTVSSVQATAKATVTRQAEQNPDLVVAMIWGCLVEIWLIGKRYQKLTAARGKLDSQLNRPDASEKPGYVEALARFSRWSAELQGLEMRLPPLLSNLAKHYGRLSERKRQELVSNEGWSIAKDPEVFAQEMFVRAKTGMRWPRGEPPFPLEPLSDWVEAWMQRERQRIANDVERRNQAVSGIGGTMKTTMEPEPFAEQTCDRCHCIDLSGSEGVALREDVRFRPSGVAWVHPRLCGFCYGRVTGSEPDPLAGIDQMPAVAWNAEMSDA